MSIELYSWPQSSGTRVSWALEELGLAYEYIRIDGKKAEHRTAQYLAINPQGKVPALVDGEITLFESGAILLHLGEKYGVDRHLWPAAGGQARADALSWTVWASADFDNYLMQYAYHGLDSPVSYKPEDRSKAAAEYSHSQFVRCLDALQARLDGREYLLGGFSLVDVAVASWLQLGSLLGVKLDSHPRVVDWVGRCSDRPACRRAR
ncbi:MAG TPA: glutathione S-transferase family protein [Casimicrobiaceae bacterium]|jgi:glutathione S-transferase